MLDRVHVHEYVYRLSSCYLTPYYVKMSSFDGKMLTFAHLNRTNFDAMWYVMIRYVNTEHIFFSLGSLFLLPSHDFRSSSHTKCLWNVNGNRLVHIHKQCKLKQCAQISRGFYVTDPLICESKTSTAICPFMYDVCVCVCLLMHSTQLAFVCITAQYGRRRSTKYSSFMLVPIHHCMCAQSNGNIPRRTSKHETHELIVIILINFNEYNRRILHKHRYRHTHWDAWVINVIAYHN